MKRKPAGVTRKPVYPNVSDIEKDRRGFLRMAGKILAGVAFMGPLARAAMADDEPSPPMKGKMKEPAPPELGGKIAVPEEPAGGVCTPGDEGCGEEEKKPEPPRKLGGVKKPPEPVQPIHKAGVMPVVKEPEKLGK